MKICKIEDCNGKVHGKGLCNKHYRQLRRTGKILTRSQKDFNQIIEYEDYAEIVLYDKENNEIAKTKIDLEDVDKCKNLKWHMHVGYVANSKMKIFLHRFIIECPDDMIVDHINRDKLDNRKCNLRICTSKENNRNMPIRKNTTQSIRGVYKSSKNSWVARIKVNGKDIYLGSFKSEEEAINARQKAEIEYFGEFAPHLNDKNKGADLTDKRN